MNLLLQTDMTYQPGANPMMDMGPAFWIPYTLVIIISIVAWWKLFEKAGQPGWAAIIPIYNLITFLRVIKRPMSRLLYYVGAIVVYMIGATMMISNPMVGGILFAIGIIALLVFAIQDYHRLSLSFGKDTGWTVGLVLLSIIFIPIMAFSKNIQYQWGEKQVDDHLVDDE